MALPGWLDSKGLALLEASPFLRARLLVAASDHGFVDGGQHARARAFRESPYDTVLLCLQARCMHDAAADHLWLSGILVVGLPLYLTFP